MNLETLNGLVNFGIAGAVIAVVMIFLKFIEKQTASAAASNEARDRLMREYFANLTTAMNQQNNSIKNALDDLIQVTRGLVEKIGTLETDLYLHDARVDKLVEKMEHPEVSAPSMMKKRER